MKNRDHKGAGLSALGACGSELDARRVQRLQTGARLMTDRTPLQVVALAADAATAAEDAVRAAAAAQPPRLPSACREGCAFCCHQTVGTAAPEVLRIAAYLRQTQTADELRSTQARVRERAEQRRALRPDRRLRARLPCPLLVADRCSVYAVRPLTCRGFNSTDARRCERALQTGSASDVPAYAPQRRLCTFVLDGLRAGLEEARLDGELLELTAALEIALAVPDAAERWLAGESLFRAARFG